MLESNCSSIFLPNIPTETPEPADGAAKGLLPGPETGSGLLLVIVGAKGEGAIVEVDVVGGPPKTL